MISTVQVQRNGRVSIPAPVRRELDIERGDVVEVKVRRVGDDR
jgi:AbrB family looped-hinge helix DNA binding protein